ncbi:MAG: MraY family glycosyltransferase, partial [Deltaproteobacteria bacterium]|nr:MraY family glycosyltransferase [Deltaproteobacteria bacterium]
MVRYLLLFFIASSLSVLLTPLSRSLSLKLGALDFPDERKVHRRPIPQLGGLSLFLTFHLVFFLASQLEFFAFPPQFLQTINYAYLLAASAIVFAMGAADDFWKISPGLKLLFQSIGGLIISFTPFRVQEISFPFGSLELGVWAIPFTVLWVVAITNALNLLDGLDGLAAGTTFIVSLSIFAIGLLNENTGSPLFCIILAGTALGFLRYNFHPASIFLGNSGAYFLGFMLSLLSLQSHAKNTAVVVILIPLLLL